MSDVKIGGFGCKVCPFMDRCSFYNPDSEYCRLEDMYLKKLLPTGQIDIELLRFLIEERLRRYVRGRIFEDLKGGLLDKHVTHLEESTTQLLEKYMKLKYPEKYGVVRVREKISTEEELGRELDEKLKKLEKIFLEAEEEDGDS